VLLAETLPDPGLHILAANGATVADVECDQLPRALLLRPDIASVIVGINDTLRPGFEPSRIAAAAGHTIGALRGAGAEVLTMRLPDPGRMLGLPGTLARPLARRARQINLVMDAAAERYGTIHFDAAGDAETYDPGMWAVDRLHPSERGHRLIARRFHAMLAAAGHQRHGLGAAPVYGPGAQPARDGLVIALHVAEERERVPDARCGGTLPDWRARLGQVDRGLAGGQLPMDGLAELPDPVGPDDAVDAAHRRAVQPR
jgi:lysophospholipase L1-like esterase